MTLFLGFPLNDDNLYQLAFVLRSIVVFYGIVSKLNVPLITIRVIGEGKPSIDWVTLLCVVEAIKF